MALPEALTPTTSASIVNPLLVVDPSDPSVSDEPVLVLLPSLPLLFSWLFLMKQHMTMSAPTQRNPSIQGNTPTSSIQTNTSSGQRALHFPLQHLPNNSRMLKP